MESGKCKKEWEGKCEGGDEEVNGPIGPNTSTPDDVPVPVPAPDPRARDSSGNPPLRRAPPFDSAQGPEGRAEGEIAADSPTAPVPHPALRLRSGAGCGTGRGRAQINKSDIFFDHRGFHIPLINR